MGVMAMHRNWWHFIMIVVGVSLFSLMATNEMHDDVTAKAANVTVSFDIYTQEMNDPEDKVAGGSTSVTLPEEDVASLTYGDAFKLAKDQVGYDFSGMIETLFGAVNNVLTPEEALIQFRLQQGTANMSQAEVDDIIAKYQGAFKNSSISWETYQTRLSQNVAPQRLEDGNDYEGEAFYVPLVKNDVTDTINYVLPDGKTAAKSRQVTGYAGMADVTIKSPSVPGYVPSQSQVALKFTKAGTYTTTVKYAKPSVADQATLTAAPTATVTAGESVTADTFNARATNSVGEKIPVSVDLSQAKLKTPGTYSVVLTAANGKKLTVTLKVSAAPQAVVTKQQAVYGSKTLYLYRKPTFTVKNRVAKYVKTKRTDRPMFVVIGYGRSQAGRLRYQVRDVNQHSRTAGKTGYITAKTGYVTTAYYQKKVQRLTVIGKSGLNTYQTVSLTGKVRHYAQGTQLKVVGISHHNLATRFVLANGHYVTANKKLVMAVVK